MKKAACVLAVLLLLGSCAHAVSAESYIAVDALTGAVLAERNAGERRLIASTTKLATAMTVLSLLGDREDALGQTVVISDAAVRVEGSSMYLKPGTEVTVRTLLYGLLLESGNDAALALAEYCGNGSVDAFVDEMNALADTLGLADTHFANPHGLDDEAHYSTARDLAVLALHAMEDERLRTITSARSFRAEGYALSNHNRLLRMVEGAEGVKTGFTKAAGRCLISSVSRGGRRVVVVTLNAPDDWNDHRALYDAAFDGMTVREYLAEGSLAAELRVQSGTACTVGVRAPAGIAMNLTDEEAARAKLRLFLPHFVYAPVQAGDAAGTAVLTLDGRTLCTAELVYETDVGVRAPRPSPAARLFAFFARLLRIQPED